RSMRRSLRGLVRKLLSPPCAGATGTSSRAHSSTAGRTPNTLSRRSLFRAIGCAFAAWTGARLLPPPLAGGRSSKTISLFQALPPSLTEAWIAGRIENLRWSEKYGGGITFRLTGLADNNRMFYHAGHLSVTERTTLRTALRIEA